MSPAPPLTRAAARGVSPPPPQDLAADLFETAQAVLSDAGFEAYEVSNHARGAAARSRHNLAYWSGADYAGVGPGAHGRLTLAGGRIATEGHRKISDYIDSVQRAGTGFGPPEPLDAVQAAQERLLMGLRTTLGVPLIALAPLGLDAHSPRLSRLADERLVELSDDRLIATPKAGCCSTASPWNWPRNRCPAPIPRPCQTRSWRQASM